MWASFLLLFVVFFSFFFFLVSLFYIQTYGEVRLSLVANGRESQVGVRTPPHPQREKEYYKNRKGTLLRMKKETNCSDARFASAIVATIRL